MAKPEFAMQLITKIKKHSMFGCLTTNGTLFSEKNIKQLVEIEWNQILFSLEGPHASIHDYMTGVRGSFNRSVKAMSLFNKYKQKLHSVKPVFSFHTVLTNINYMHLKRMIEWSYNLRTCGVCFEPINVWSEDGAKLKLSDEETKEFQRLIPEALAFAKKLNVPTNLENLQETRLVEKKKMDEILLKDVEEIKQKSAKKYPLFNALCYNPWLNLEIRISGHVVPCRLCDTHQYASKLQTKTLKEIWLGKYFKRIRSQIIAKRLPRYCKTCASGVVVDFREIRKELSNSRNGLIKIITTIKNQF